MTKTFFNTGVFSFDDVLFGPGHSQASLNIPALKLFLVICIPLMIVTMMLWALAYGVSRKNLQKGKVLNKSIFPV